jgi:Transcriptional Coactivator p15 (PC4)
VRACAELQKDGELLPGKKGISLLPEQFERLRGEAAAVDAAIAAKDTLDIGLSNKWELTSAHRLPRVSPSCGVVSFWSATWCHRYLSLLK